MLTGTYARTSVLFPTYTKFLGLPASAAIQVAKINDSATPDGLHHPGFQTLLQLFQTY